MWLEIVEGRAGAALDVLRQRNLLSPRTRQVLMLLLAGYSGKQIAGKLGISDHTVHEYLKVLHRRFGANSRGELLSKIFFKYILDGGRQDSESCH